MNAFESNRFIRIIAITLTFLAACTSGQDTSTPAKTLIGHWLQENEKGRVHFCFLNNGTHIIYSEIDNTINQFPYRTGTQYLDKNAVEFAAGKEPGWRIIQFSKDGKTAEVTLPPLTKPYTTWKYVDGDSKGCGK